MKNEIKKNLSIREKTHNGVDNLMDKAENVGEKGKEEIARLKGKAIMMRKNVDSHIQKNPERSVLIAAGVGAVIGVIFTTIFMRRKS